MSMGLKVFETAPELLVKLSCAVLPDAALLEAALEHYIAPSAGQASRAYAYLSHYLAGRGDDVRFDLRKLLCDCPSVASKIAGGISSARRAGQQRGAVLITQADYRPTPPASRDWQLALGGFSCAWHFAAASPGSVVLAVDNRYEFHGRYEWTRCVHEAAIRLARSGTPRPFRMLGRTTMPWGSDPSGMRTESWR